jgi:hypothetical protein
MSKRNFETELESADLLAAGGAAPAVSKGTVGSSRSHH